MRFPLRLTAEITKAKWRKLARGGAGDPIVLRVQAPLGGAASGDVSSQGDDAILKQVGERTSPVVWIDGPVGDDPLRYSGIGHLARRVVDGGRTVFVETDGALLRRCVFSFRPVAQLFLAVQLDGMESSHDRRTGRAGLRRAAMEGIRAAKLSGFMICAMTRVYENTDLEEIAELHKEIASLDLDGWVIMLVPGETAASPLQKKVLAVRAMAGSGWASFSRLVELTVRLPITQRAAVDRGFSSSETHQDACEEGVRVP
jgi:hypothetical protein